MAALGLNLAVLACFASAPLIVLTLECLLALLPLRRVQADGRGRVAVLVPAHNEELVLRATLDAVLPQLDPGRGDRLLVVADNCTDSTAQIARDAGADVLERTDDINRGKGFALAAGVARLGEAENPPDVVIVLDADCHAADGMVEALSAHALSTQRPIQALYLMDPPPDAGPGDVVSTFAFLVKNQVRARGLHRLGLPVLLTGSGMAFPWSVITGVDLATGNIVEDLALGLELTARGQGPVYCEAALVTGQLPSGDAAANAQRTRWEHGYLQTILHQCPRLLVQSVTRLRPALAFAAVDLAVPPLSLLVILAGLVWVLSLVGGAVTGVWWGAAVLGVSGLLASGALLLAWAGFARQLIPGRALVAVPIYALKKLPMYFRFVGRRQKAWVRTAREPGENND